MFPLRWLLLGLLGAAALGAPTVIVVLANRQEMPDILRTLGSSTAAAWVQGVGSLVAVVVALYVPQRERWLARQDRDTQRLGVMTSRRADTGHLQVEFAYDPESRNVGYEVRVKLLDPKDAFLVRAIRHTVYQTAGGQPYTAVNADSLKDLGRSVRAAFGWTYSDPDQRLRADVLIGAGDHMLDQAEISVEVWTAANPRRLLRSRMFVSPSIEPPRLYGQLPMSPMEGNSL
jgi:hypothetical protein